MLPVEETPGSGTLERAYADHRRHIYNYFRRSGISPETSDDLTQTVFTTLMSTLGRFAPERGSLLSFLFGIARNHRRAHFRQSRRSPRAPRAAPVPGSSEEVVIVREAVLALPDEQGEALILREFHGLSYDEIATLQGVPVGTVRSRLSRARDALRATLLPQGARP